MPVYNRSAENDPYVPLAPLKGKDGSLLYEGGTEPIVIKNLGITVG